MFNLRYYQDELIEGAEKCWESHRSTAMISATGTGKTEMYLSLVVNRPGRWLVLGHRDYLLKQPIDRLAKVGFDDVAIEKADVRSEVGFMRAKVVFGSVQSLGPASQQKRLDSYDPFAFDGLVIDEAHRATSPTYRRIIDHFHRNPRLKSLFMTATPKRKDGIALGTVCESVAGTYMPREAINESWIVPVVFERRDVKSLDFSNVSMKGGDLNPEQVESLQLQEKPLHEVLAPLAEDRGATLVFCAKVGIAQALADTMNKRYRPGRAIMLCDESTWEERDEASKRMANGDLDYIFNVNLFTEGYDLPGLQRVVWACPTASLVRYTQGVGRVFRTHGSLRDHLVGGREDAPTRKQFIEQSPKPFGNVVTYYPQNCKHVLCDPVDILGGDDIPAPVVAAAKQIQAETSQQAGGSRTDYDIDTAKIFVDLQGVVEQKRNQIKAKAVYTDDAFDPFSGRVNDAGEKRNGKAVDAAMKSVGADWPQGEPPTAKQMGWFAWKKIILPHGCTKFRCVVIRDLIELGVKPETATNYNRAQALAVRDSMKLKAERKAV